MTTQRVGGKAREFRKVVTWKNTEMYKSSYWIMSMVSSILCAVVFLDEATRTTVERGGMLFRMAVLVVVLNAIIIFAIIVETRTVHWEEK